MCPTQHKQAALPASPRGCSSALKPKQRTLKSSARLAASSATSSTHASSAGSQPACLQAAPSFPALGTPVSVPSFASTKPLRDNSWRAQSTPKGATRCPRWGQAPRLVGEELQDIPEPRAQRQELPLQAVGTEKQIPRHPRGSLILCCERLGINSFMLKLK